MNQLSIKFIIIIVVILLVVAGGGYFLYLAGQATGQNQAALIAKQEQEQLLQEIFGNIMANSLSGQIKEIHSDQKSLSAVAPSVLGVNIPKKYQNKNLSIKDNAKIILQANKPTEVFNKEISAYQSKPKKSGLLFTPLPLPYSEKEITLNDLKVGDNITFVFDAPANKSAILSSDLAVNQIFVRR